MSVIVRMLETEIETAIELGKIRTKAKINSEDTENYKAGKENGKLLPDDIANARSNISECAVAYLTNQTWNMPIFSNRYYYVRRHFADVGENTEVRTIRTDPRISITENTEVRTIRTDPRISITKKDQGRIVYGCAVSDDLTEVEVLGWVNADDVMIPKFYVEETYPNGRQYKGWRIPIEALNSPPPLPKWLSVAFE